VPLVREAAMSALGLRAIAARALEESDPVDVRDYCEERRHSRVRWPDDEVIVWKLLVQERRPQPKREQNGNIRTPNAGEAYPPPSRDLATADSGQHATGDPARPLDDDLPF
jgi:hypothetical protein